MQRGLRDSTQFKLYLDSDGQPPQEPTSYQLWLDNNTSKAVSVGDANLHRLVVVNALVTCLTRLLYADITHIFAVSEGYGAPRFAECAEVLKDDAGFVTDGCLTFGVHMSTIVTVCTMYAPEHSQLFLTS